MSPTCWRSQNMAEPVGILGRLCQQHMTVETGPASILLGARLCQLSFPEKVCRKKKTYDPPHTKIVKPGFPCSPDIDGHTKIVKPGFPCCPDIDGHTKIVKPGFPCSPDIDGHTKIVKPGFPCSPDIDGHTKIVKPGFPCSPDIDGRTLR